MNLLAAAPLALACALSLAAAWTDAKTGKIPNRLTIPALVVGLGLGVIEAGLMGLGSALLGAFMCFCVPYALFRASRGTAIGGGDVKLFAALGALLGPSAGLEVELASLIVLAVFALLVLTWRGRLWGLLKRTFWLSINWALPKARRQALEPEMMISMRMGPAICLATWGFSVLEVLPLVLV